MTKPFSLSKHERLKSKKDIDTLFLTGKAFFVFPFKLFYLMQSSSSADQPLLFGVSVPKKLFKRAVDRNKIKRRVRELYRIAKPELSDHLSGNNKMLHIMFVYTNKEIMSSMELRPAMAEVIKKLKEKMQS